MSFGERRRCSACGRFIGVETSDTRALKKHVAQPLNPRALTTSRGVPKQGPRERQAWCPGSGGIETE